MKTPGRFGKVEEHCMKRFLSTGIVLFWGVMVALLIYRTTSLHTPAAPLPTSPVPAAVANLPTPQEPQEGWMGIYYQNKKVGYFHRRLLPTETGYRWEEQSRMQLRVLDTPQTMYTEIRASLDQYYALKDFSFRLLSTGAIFQVTGVVTPEE